jgi:hypothetical protein
MIVIVIMKKSKFAATFGHTHQLNYEFNLV